jgi:hypothetical protein
MTGQARFEPQWENHGNPARKLHQRGAAFCNKIFVVRRSETEGGSQKNDSAVWWKLFEWKESVPVRRKISRRPNICRPCTAVSHANVAHADALIGEKRRISVNTVVTMLNISVGSAHGIIQDNLKYRCVPGGCWDSWPIQSCRAFLTRCRADGAQFLAHTVTGVKPGFTIMNQNPNDNSWNGDTSSPAKKKFQVDSLCRKTYAYIVLWYELTNSRTLLRERRDSQQREVQHHAEEKL